MSGAKPYRAPDWLPGGHAQTLWPLLIKPRPIALRRERWDTPDGDFIDVDLLDGPPEAPLLVLFHGLEGSARSHYAISTARRCQSLGWRFALPHFRGCSGELNRRPIGPNATRSARACASNTRTPAAMSASSPDLSRDGWTGSRNG